MAVLRWKHGKTASEARSILERKLEELGYSENVKWNMNVFSAKVGFGAALNIKGIITDAEAVLENCGGAGGGKALKTIREILAEQFPGGEVI